MKSKHIIIYGGSSLISIELFKILAQEYNQFTIFCRKRNIVEEYINEIKTENLKISIYETDLLDLEKNFSFIEKLENNISGLIWISGLTGKPDEELLDPIKCETVIRINFLNPVLCINKIIPKIETGKNSFIVVLTSVAGLRGRSKQLFYSSAKSGFITYLSGLRQKLFTKKINVITVIPGYMRTKAFEAGEWKAPFFLISSPKKSAQIIYKAIKSKKEIVYINFFWRIIMFCISFIPEKIFKRLKF